MATCCGVVLIITRVEGLRRKSVSRILMDPGNAPNGRGVLGSVDVASTTWTELGYATPDWRLLARLRRDHWAEEVSCTILRRKGLAEVQSRSSLLLLVQLLMVLISVMVVTADKVRRSAEVHQRVRTSVSSSR